MVDDTLRVLAANPLEETLGAYGANVVVASAFATLAVLLAVAGALNLPGIPPESGGVVFGPVFALAFAAFHVGAAYGYHWHGTHTFAGTSPCFALGTAGALLGGLGLVVQFFAPAAGLFLAVGAVFLNALGNGWGTFVYNARTHAGERVS